MTAFDNGNLGYFESLGIMSALATCSPLHRRWYLADLETHFAAALRVGQCKIFFGSRRNPVAFATWALVDDECHAALRATGRTPAPENWACGDHLWFIDVIAPFGGAHAVVRDLQRNHFAHVDRAYSIRRNGDGSMKKITVWRQRPAMPGER